MSMDELTSPKTSIHADAVAFSKGIDFSAEAATVAIESDSFDNNTIPSDDGDVGGLGQWADDDFVEKSPELEASPKAKVDISEEPSQTIKFKANGEEVELSLAEAQKRLSLAEGARQALEERSNLRKELKSLKEQAQELAQYKDTWDKLESVKHDRKQLLELITGESYDDLIARESDRREIYQNGTEEQRQLLEYAERLQRLEREKELDSKKRETSLKRAEEAQFNAEKQRVQTAMEREYYKHKLPEGLEESSQNKLKAMLWQQSAADLKAYYSKYGKITNKMVEKAFGDNANLLISSHRSAVDTQVAQTRETQKQAAKEKAQLASVKESAGMDPKLANMNPNQLFDFFRRGK